MKMEAWLQVARAGCWEITSLPYTGSQKKWGKIVNSQILSPVICFLPSAALPKGSVTSPNSTTNMRLSVQTRAPMWEISHSNHHKHLQVKSQTSCIQSTNSGYSLRGDIITRFQPYDCPQNQLKSSKTSLTPFAQKAVGDGICVCSPKGF